MGSVQRTGSMSWEKARKQYPALTILLLTGVVLLFRLGSCALGIAEEPPNDELKTLAESATDSNWKRSQDALKALSRLGPKAVPVLPQLLQHYFKSPSYPVGDVIIAMGESGAALLARDLEKRDQRELMIVVTLLRDMGPKGNGAAPKLASLLKRTDRETRSGILEALAAMGPGTKEVLPEILDALGDSDEWVFERAKYALAVLGPPAIPALLDRLAEQDPEWRRRAASTLETMGPGAWTSILALREALGDTDMHVRVQAARALFAIEGDVQAVAVINEGLRSKKEAVLWSVLEWLDNVGPRGAAIVPDLIRFLEDSPSQSVRDTILRTIGSIGPEAKAATHYLVASIHKDPRDMEAQRALWLIDRNPHALRLLLSQLEGNDPSARSTAVFFFQSMRPLTVEALPALLRLLSRRQELHVVIPCLSDLGSVAKEAVPDLLLLLKPQSGSDFDKRSTLVTDRIEAAHALWRIRSDAELVIPILVNVLNAKVLWDYGGRSLFNDPEVVFGKAWAPTSFDVSRAAEILGEIGPGAKDAVPVLKEALGAANRTIRASAIEALWRIERDAQGTVYKMLQFLASESPPFSSQNNFGLDGDSAPRRGDVLVEAGSQAIFHLINALQRPEPQVRAHVAGALAAIGPVAIDAIPALSRAARDSDIRVANAAIRALRGFGPQGREALDKVLPPSEMLPPRKRK